MTKMGACPQITSAVYSFNSASIDINETAGMSSAGREF
jgi:hypothetical protein